MAATTVSRSRRTVIEADTLVRAAFSAHRFWLPAVDLPCSDPASFPTAEQFLLLGPLAIIIAGDEAAPTS